MRLGDIQLESDSEDDEIKVNTMKVEASTDTPQFMILNIVPGRPDSSLFDRIKMKKPAEKPSRIRDMVAELKAEKIKKGEAVTEHKLERVFDRFALLKGEISSDVREI